MIARAPYLFLLLIIIPDLYLDLHYWRHRSEGTWSVRRMLYWLPAIGMTALTIYLMYDKNFIPDNPTILYIYLFLLGFIIVPKWIYMICSITGLGACRLFHSKKNFGNLIGLLLVPLLWFILIYGSTIGFQKLEVNHQTYTSPDLPAAFDGYKIVLFSDAHVGSYAGRQQYILQKAIDSINAQHPDLIVYTGDLQNIQPQEVYEHMDILAQLKAKDGIYSVLGNHDYAFYVECDEARKVANVREIVSLEKQLGWTLLRNEHRTIKKGKDHIVIAGMENDGGGQKYLRLGRIDKALKEVKDGEFVVMLEHDPSAWRRKIIRDGRAQLTLSGHTHKMQFTLFGWCPLSLKDREYNGWYTEGTQSLFVTAGLGGLIPFRFGATGEIVVIKMKKTNSKD